MGTGCERAFVISCVGPLRSLFQLPLKNGMCSEGSRWEDTKAPCLSSCPHVGSPSRHLQRAGARSPEACHRQMLGLALLQGKGPGGKEVRLEGWVFERWRVVGEEQTWPILSPPS